MASNVTIYTDGACKGNPGPGGWACVLLCNGREKRLSGGEDMTTNNRMELLSVINGLAFLTERCKVTVISDSKYIVDAINNRWLPGWKRNGWARSDGALKNTDLWMRLDELLQKQDCKFQWIKGHNGNRYNEICDKLAVEESVRHSAPTAVGNTSSEPEQIGFHELVLPAAPVERRRYDEAIAALDDALRRLHSFRDGLEHPCGLHDYCMDCAGGEFCCARSFLAMRTKAHPA